jgi:hypothetical protein
VISYLALDGVGPAKQLAVEFSSRLNLITGDNGLGKSFLLDTAWWALAQSWPSKDGQALPRPDASAATLKARFSNGGKTRLHFDFPQQKWLGRRADSVAEEIVIYAQVDGSFAVSDPARQSGNNGADFLFDPSQVWNGIQEDGTWRCNALYRDWANWQRERNDAFDQLKRALLALSPPGEELAPGDLCRISVEDVRDYPTIRMPYGIDVPVLHASAAIRRVLALAYLLIWTWREHLQAATLRRQKPATQLVLIVDEIEAHLHPAWQRRILPSVLGVMEKITASAHSPAIQLIVTTHSPLVCVSMESAFDGEIDRLIDLEPDPELGVRVQVLPFSKYGTGENWLLSSHFSLKSTYSEQAERALAGATELV